MLGFSQEEIDALIACPKVITEPPKKEMRLERGHRRNEIGIRSKDGEHEFHMFVRVNERFPENFSVGLDYVPVGGGKPVPLLRCNGPHGDFNKESATGESHFRYHVHRTDAEALKSGQDPLARASSTSAYASVNGAIIHVCQLTHVAGYQAYYPEMTTAPLWRSDGPDEAQL